LAEEAGITELAVSLTHEGDVAAAVVVALCHRGGTDTVDHEGTSSGTFARKEEAI
jgi:hypothetical protein